MDKHESLKEWQESHQTSNPRLAKKHGIKLIEEHKESKLHEKKEKMGMKFGSQHRSFGSTKKSDRKHLKDYMDVPDKY